MGGGVRKALRLPAGHNDGQIGAEFLKFMKNFPSIFRIQIQIQQNNVNLVLGVEENRFVAGRGAEYFVIFGGKNSRQRLPNSNIVLNEQQITLTNHLTPLITSFVPKSRNLRFVDLQELTNLAPLNSARPRKAGCHLNETNLPRRGRFVSRSEEHT